ncbi:multidrug effflux MFS transporter [Lysobacter korlensis]|uniref:Bcr/CflA family efflux transporter n=1 Tax=Lysobacter korlensis TaxID=553636 RepID=A0ABV6RT75_9GAMM
MTRGAKLRLVVVLGLTQMVWTLAMDLYLPSFLEIRDDFGTSEALVQATLTGAFLGMTGGQLLTGPVSDAVGRKRPLLVVLMAHVLSSILCALAPSIEVLLVGRVFQGMASAASGIIILAVLRDSFAGPELIRMLARLAMVNGTAILFAPSLGAMLLEVMSWRGIFWVLAGYGALTVVLITLALREPERQTPGGRVLSVTLGNYRTLLGDRVYLATVAVAALVWASMFTYLASSAFLFQGLYGLSPTQYALVFASHGGLMVLGAQFSARLARRVSAARIAVGAGIGMCVSAVVLVVSAVLLPGTGFLGLLVPLWFFTTALGMFNPASQALALKDHKPRSGTAASLLGAANAGLGALISPLAGLIGLGSMLPTVGIMLVCQVLALGVLLIAVAPAAAADRRAARGIQAPVSSR